MAIKRSLYLVEFFQAGLVYKQFEKNSQGTHEPEFGLEVIKTEHIILPLIIIAVFHVITLVIFLCQVMIVLCKY